MGTKTKARQHQFRERAAKYSTRISARGTGFADQWIVEPVLEQSLADAIESSIAAGLEAFRAESEVGEMQLNRMRGKLGQFQKQLGNPKYWDTADAFMTVARACLPEVTFEQLMAETRACRDRQTLVWASQIDAFMRMTKRPRPTARSNVS